VNTRSESQVLDAVIGEIDEFLAAQLRARGMPENLESAICYSTLGGGKRLRPALVLLCCQAVGGQRADALGPAAAIELIHNFSLVHDDLPAMDDDELRRGRPTLHVHAGEAMAILAGDAMISIAFEFIAESPLSPESIVGLTRELASATTAMVNGQVYDTLGGFPAGIGAEEKLKLVDRNKTAALLRAACRMGGVCGSAGNQSMEALTGYGEAIGLMFQVVDDLLDVTQSAEHIGKATGKDIQAGKVTWPGVLGVDASRTAVQRLRDQALQSLAPLGPAADPLRELCDDMAVRTK
jgi:geranylgeranyl diphosphate synthase type II